MHQSLLESKHWGIGALDEVCRYASNLVNMTTEDLRGYFNLLNYELNLHQQEGLMAFYRFLHRYGTLQEMPTLESI